MTLLDRSSPANPWIIYGIGKKHLVACKNLNRSNRLHSLSFLDDFSYKRKIFNTIVRCLCLMNLDRIIFSLCCRNDLSCILKYDVDELQRNIERDLQIIVDAVTVKFPSSDRTGRSYLILSISGAPNYFVKCASDEMSRMALGTEICGYQQASSVSGHYCHLFSINKPVKSDWLKRTRYVIFPCINEYTVATPNAVGVQKVINKLNSYGKWIPICSLFSLRWWDEHCDEILTRSDTFRSSFYKYCDSGCTVGIAHGDFTPANCRVGGAGLTTFDLEDFSVEAPTLVDTINLIFFMNRGAGNANQISHDEITINFFSAEKNGAEVFSALVSLIYLSRVGRPEATYIIENRKS